MITREVDQLHSVANFGMAPTQLLVWILLGFTWASREDAINSISSAQGNVCMLPDSYNVETVHDSIGLIKRNATLVFDVSTNACFETEVYIFLEGPQQTKARKVIGNPGRYFASVSLPGTYNVSVYTDKNHTNSIAKFPVAIETGEDSLILDFNHDTTSSPMNPWTMPLISLSCLGILLGFILTLSMWKCPPRSYDKLAPTCQEVEAVTSV